MILADVLAEVVDSSAFGEAVELRDAEHCALADDAWREKDCVDCCVEFSVGGAEEEFFQTAAEEGRSGLLDGWRRSFHCQGEQVDKLVGLKEIDHARESVLPDPYIAVDDPDDVAHFTSLAVGVAHISDLWVGPEVQLARLEFTVFFLDEDAGVVFREVVQQLLQDWERWIVARRDAEADVQTVLRIRLLEGAGQTGVQESLWSFHRADDGDVRIRGDACAVWGPGVVAKSDET